MKRVFIVLIYLGIVGCLGYKYLNGDNLGVMIEKGLIKQEQEIQKRIDDVKEQGLRKRRLRKPKKDNSQSQGHGEESRQKG